MNIIIRRMKSSDADALYRLLSDPEVMRYLEPLYDRAQTEAFLHRAGLSEPRLCMPPKKTDALSAMSFIIHTMRKASKLAGCFSQRTGGAGTRQR